jgi:bis(5'-nucleosidyl)-tetraphosphatase
MKIRQSTSYGVIPCVKEGKEWKVFMVQHQKNLFWGFPKGHAEKGETPLEAAQRELFEETEIEVLEWLREEPLLEQYVYQDKDGSVEKKVFFYLAITTEEFEVDSKEIVDGKWVSLKEAKELISYKEGLSLLSQIESILKNL